ncbi:ABC transporter permease [Dokdonella sp.]|uniref:ABC transporter permease n=1 Tax=Dokdonella sp. TaxID=2291710 RepID=UPI0025C14E10|nr:ABC transporter permease [Dokdonella sp.]MBX3688458.1 ABC transporter permease [Dokdonella sp.]
MSVTLIDSQSVPAAPAPPIARLYLLEARHEFLRLLRTPMFCIPTLLFPAMFYLLFGVVMNRGTVSGGFIPAVYMLAGYGVFGVMAPGLFGFGASVASDRDSGWLRWRRAMPMPPGAYLLAKLAMAMLFALLVGLILALIAVTLGGVRLPLSSWALLFAVEVLGVLPFCAIGLLIGSMVSAQAAPAIINLVFLPMSFLSGLWLPLMLLPKVLQDVAVLWPAWHLGQLAYAAVGQPNSGSMIGHVVVLAGITGLFLVLARRRLARG